MRLRTWMWMAATLVVAPVAQADWSVTVPDGPELVFTNAFVDDDGSTLVASRSILSTDLTLIDVDGTVRWRKIYSLEDVIGAAVAFGRDRICFSGTTRGGAFDPSPIVAASASCVARADGALLFSIDRAITSFSPIVATRADGSVLVLERFSSGGAKVLDIAADGTVISDTQLSGSLTLTQSPSGDIHLVRIDRVNAAQFAWRYEFLTTTGVQLGAFTEPVDPNNGDFRTPVGVDGNRVAIRYRDPQRGDVVAVLRGDGSVQNIFGFSTISVPTAVFAPIASEGRVDAVGLFFNVLLAIELRDDGTLGAQRPLPRNADVSRLRGDPIVAQVSDDFRKPGRIREQVYDFRSGETIRDSYAPTSETPLVLRVTPDGDVISATRIANATLVRSRTDFASPPPSVPARQLGVRGAWAGTYTSGQGVLIDVDLASGTVFAPWFTYSRAVEDGTPSQTRWYTLQGTAAPNAASVPMTIFENTGGNFSAGPDTNARAIGVATLTFESCDRATLAYDFDGGGIAGGENGGVADFITLTRLTPATDDCVQHDATVVDVDVPAPVGGFDAKLTGTWLDPAFGGQGFSLIVRPGESIFGAWFTYDTPPFQEDATRQQWYTLQGALPANGGGSVVLPVFHTSGGFFDDAQQTAAANYGSATLTVEACDRIRLDYRVRGFGANFATVYTGTQVLRRFGGCAR